MIAHTYTPIILVLGRQRQEDREFKANLGFISDPVSKTKQKR
jgi:hypothetical protein